MDSTLINITTHLTRCPKNKLKKSTKNVFNLGKRLKFDGSLVFNIFLMFNIFIESNFLFINKK